MLASICHRKRVDWVCRRMGHRSITATMVYLHTLAELEMETRMALVPDDWHDPRATPINASDDMDTIA
ncbi:hypothetical protein [Rhodococcus opacus]|uniref:hypothetical protein n=1 Tax=Rhodococcus opacus TaxID=37919 RepID=UPI000B1FFF9D|nr:hypothetical protein [Rhodococcus opacus]